MINSNQLTVPCVGSVKQGDSVMIITRNGEPVAVAPIGWGDAVEADISDAATKATSYITDISNAGIMVHPSDDSTTGVQITDDVDIMRSGTSVINIGTNDAVRVGVAGENNIAITDSGVSFSMPYDDGGGHAGTVDAEMHPEYDGAPAFVIKHGPTILKLLSNLSMSLTGNLLVSDGVEANTASVRNWLKVGTSGTGTIYGQSGVLTVSAASPSVHARTNESNPTNARDVSLTATSTKRGLYDNGQNGKWIVYADDNNGAVVNGMSLRATGTSGAQNYFTLLNPTANVGVQFIFNPSTLNLVVRYTTNGGTNWSATRTIASWA